MVTTFQSHDVDDLLVLAKDKLKIIRRQFYEEHSPLKAKRTLVYLRFITDELKERMKLAQEHQSH